MATVSLGVYCFNKPQGRDGLDMLDPNRRLTRHEKFVQVPCSRQKWFPQKRAAPGSGAYLLFRRIFALFKTTSFWLNLSRGLNRNPTLPAVDVHVLSLLTQSRGPIFADTPLGLPLRHFHVRKNKVAPPADRTPRSEGNHTLP